MSYVHWILDPHPLELPWMRRNVGDYDFRNFDYVARIRDEIFQCDAETTKKDKTAFDIEIGDTQLRWNSIPTYWISSSNALEEVGSIHTVQGCDLNYVRVIEKGKENNPGLGKTYSDDDLLGFITQIYAVLMTRGIRGTYVYACDPGLWEYLKGFIPFHS